MNISEDLYIVPDDLFRLGNSTGPKLSHVRPIDIDVFPQNGIEVVIANRKGISVWTDVGIRNSPMNGWVWKLKRGLVLPAGLMVYSNKPHHYLICPTRIMPVSEFKALLENLALNSEKVYQKATTL